MTKPGDERVVALMDLATRQHGLVSARQGVQLGLHKDTLSLLAGKGLLHRERRGIYRVASVPRAPVHAVVEAVLLTGGVVSHRSAASRFEMLRAPSRVVEVTVGGRDRPRDRPGIIVHRSRCLLPDEVTAAGGLRTTTPARTLVDLADPSYGMTERELRSALGGALQRRRPTAPQLLDYLDSSARRARGLRRLREQIHDLTAIHLDSVAEEEVLDLLLQAGLPKPRAGYVVNDEHGQFLAKVDLAWPREKVAVEVDGWAYHSDPASFHLDRSRGNALVLAGWMLLRLTPRRVRLDPGGVVGEVSEALRSRRPS
ncbi:MAG: type IV toxin-antitoxin system AbiEi family antitoxin domain-containing protein [Acidimicrobiales bacterium]